jgi:hypothetical protein
MNAALGAVRSFCQNERLNVAFSLFIIDNAESIPCPFDQSWYFKKDPQICQPKAFHNCFSIDTFQVSYNNRCQSNQGLFVYLFYHVFIMK